MRPAQKQNRARGRGNRKGGGGGGNNVNRVYESAGPEGKVRGTPQQIVDKYLSLARDAQTAGDRVTGENFLQHAEHYQRILLAAMGAQAERREASSSEDEDDDTPEERPSMNGQAVGAHQNGDARDDETADEDEDQGTESKRRGRSRRGRAGTERRGDDQPEARDAAEERDDDPRSTDNTARAESHEIGGFDTIDTDDGAQGDLLVATEETAKSQPRRRRTTTRRKSAAGEAEETAKPEEKESAAGKAEPEPVAVSEPRASQEQAGQEGGDPSS